MKMYAFKFIASTIKIRSLLVILNYRVKQKKIKVKIKNKTTYCADFFPFCSNQFLYSEYISLTKSICVLFFSLNILLHLSPSDKACYNLQSPPMHIFFSIRCQPNISLFILIARLFVC
jgi:hypothetical protein